MKISNFKGFTLIELLVSVGLFSALATVIISVLFISFRTSKKSDVIISVKQSGNSALSQMVSKIRFAKSLDDPITCVPDVTQNSITITAFDGGQTVYGCPGVMTESISSNSAALVDINTITVDSCSFTCSQTTTNDPPTITIKFTLSATNETGFVENSTSIPFQTSITLRNYNR